MFETVMIKNGQISLQVKHLLTEIMPLTWNIETKWSKNEVQKVQYNQGTT